MAFPPDLHTTLAHHPRHPDSIQECHFISHSNRVDNQRGIRIGSYYANEMPITGGGGGWGWGWGWWEKDQRLVTSARWDLGPGSVQWGSVSVRQRHLGPAWSTVAHRWPLTARPAHRWRRVRPLSIRAHSDAFQEMMELPLCFQNLNLDDQFLIFLIFLIFGVVTGNIQIGSVQQQQQQQQSQTNSD